MGKFLTAVQLRPGVLSTAVAWSTCICAYAGGLHYKEECKEDRQLTLAQVFDDSWMSGRQPGKEK